MVSGSSNRGSFLNQYPEFLPPERPESKALLSKIKSIKKVVHQEFDRNKEMISGFESRASVFPQYDDYTVFRTTNVKDREHFMAKK